MKAILAHASIATVLSVFAPLSIVWAVVTSTGAIMDGFAITMCIICMTLVVFPASAYSYNQRRVIEQSHAALSEAHDQLESMHRRLAERARRDEMTGLLNRATFVEMIDGMQAAGRWGSLLVIDADNFKQVNDTHGHQTGDEALCAIARALTAAVRQSDLRGRIGGEEFGVFVTGAAMDNATIVAERVRYAVQSVDFRPGGRDRVPLTVSIGVAAARTGATFSELMAEADERLYEAKRKGRNIVIMPPSASVAA